VFNGPPYPPSIVNAPTGDRFVARHRTQALGTEISFCLSAPADLPRRRIGEAIAAAVAEIRAVEAAFSPFRPRSLVSAVRRGELLHEAYPPPLADVVERCARMRAATDGWFDAWAVPGGFDPLGLIKGWAVDRAAALLAAGGVDGCAIRAGADRLVHGTAPHGGPWRIGLPAAGDALRRTAAVELTEGALAVAGGTSARRDRIMDPHTGLAAHPTGAAAVAGPELCFANAYAVALCAAGSAGLDWFPTADGYRAIVLDGRPTPPPVPPRVLPPATAQRRTPVAA
jgi:FAD:protein FMN transferase